MENIIVAIKERVKSELRNKLIYEIATGIYSENVSALKGAEIIETNKQNDENATNEEFDTLKHGHYEKMRRFQVSYIVRMKIFDNL